MFLYEDIQGFTQRYRNIDSRDRTGSMNEKNIPFQPYSGNWSKSFNKTLLHFWD